MADTKQLTEMLKRLGWGSGFRLPIANEENRKLEELLDQKQSRLVALSTDVQEATMAVENMSSFLKNLGSKIKHCKDLEAAKMAQIEKERQIVSLSEREHAKTEQDMRKLGKQIDELAERNRILECNVMRRKDNLGELIDVINFDKKAIAAFEEKFNKEDAYIEFINEVAETDNERAKKCQDEYQKIGETIEKSKVKLNQTIGESEILENEFEALAKRFRKAHDERNQSIENWKGTLMALESRDEEIMHVCYDHNQVALNLKQSRDMLEKQEAFFAQIEQQTKDYMRELSYLERKMSHLHRQKREVELVTEESQDAISELAQYIMQIDREIKSVIKQMDKLSNETDTWFDKMLTVKGELDSMKAKYDVVTMEQLTSNEHFAQLQEFLEKEEKREEVLVKELEKQTLGKSQRETQLIELKHEATLVAAEERNLNSAISSCKKKESTNLDLLMKRRQLEYRLEHQVMQLSTKIRSIENPQSSFATNEDYLKFQGLLTATRDKLADLIKNKNLIMSQTQHCEHVMVLCSKELQKEREENDRYEIQLQRQALQSKRITREKESIMEDIKDLIVTQSMVQLQMKKMLTSIQTYESKMLNLEQERLTLQTVVKSRKKDIETYCTLLLGKKRTLQDESQKLRVKCHDVSCEAQSRKRKYEMVLQQMWKGEGEDESSQQDSEGSGRSEAYYIIKLAQEREQYKQEGDKWDERVKEAEKIVEGLQNTLALMIGTNEVFKDSLKPATANTEEGRQLQELKDQQLQAARNLKLAKNKRAECRGKLQQMQGAIDDAIADKNALEQLYLEKQYELQGLIIEINGQKQKIKRATLQANKLVKELSKLESLDAELLQNDLRLRITKEKYEFAVSTLEKFLLIHPNMLGETLEFLQEKNMNSLCDRITRKLYSPTPSMLSSPHGSETDTASVRKSKSTSLIRSSRLPLHHQPRSMTSISKSHGHDQAP